MTGLHVHSPAVRSAGHQVTSLTVCSSAFLSSLSLSFSLSLSLSLYLSLSPLSLSLSLSVSRSSPPLRMPGRSRSSFLLFLSGPGHGAVRQHPDRDLRHAFPAPQRDRDQVDVHQRALPRRRVRLSITITPPLPPCAPLPPSIPTNTAYVVHRALSGLPVGVAGRDGIDALVDVRVIPGRYG